VGGCAKGVEQRLSKQAARPMGARRSPGRR
jgi:hypothetical protein